MEYTITLYEQTSTIKVAYQRTLPEDAEGAGLWRGEHTFLDRDLHGRGMNHDAARETIETELLGAFLHVVPERIVRAILILAGY